MVSAPSTSKRRELIRGAWLLGVGVALGAAALPLLTSTIPSTHAL